MQHVPSRLQLLLHPGDKPDWTGADCSLVCPAGPASSPPAAGSAKDALLPSPSPPALPISSLGPGVDPMSFSRAFWKTQPGVLRIPAYTPPSCLCPGSGPVSLSVPLIPRRSSRLPDLCTDLSLLAPPAPCSPGISAWDRDLGSSLHSRLGQSSCHTYW